MSSPQPSSVQQSSHTSVYNPYTRTINPSSSRTPVSHTTAFQTLLPSHQPHPDDTKWFGQKISERVNTCRFLLQNPNGIDTSDKCIDFGIILEDMKRYKVDMILLPETNINAKNYQLVDQLRAAASSHLNHGILNITNTPLFPPSTFQPGGVLTATQSFLSSRTASVSTDPAGRWTCQSFYGKHSFLKVYCLYRVCPLTSDGVITAAAQQTHYFLETSNASVNPREKVIDDLLSCIQRDLDRGNDIILTGDFNEALGDKEGTHERLQSLGLTNVLQHMLEDLPRTFVRGKNCIDHLYASSRVLQALTSVGIAPFEFFIRSDHRAIYFDINIRDVLDVETNHFPPFIFRRLKMTSKSAVSSYQKTIKRKYKSFKIRARLRRISKAFKSNGPTPDNISALNTLDNDITTIMMSAERSCSSVNKTCNSPWSPQLKSAIRDYRRAKQALRKLKKKPSPPPTLLAQALESRRKARTHYKETVSKASEYRTQFLLNQAEFVADCRNSNAYIEYSNLIRYEKLRNSFAKIRRCLKGSFSGSLSSTLIPSRDSYPIDQQNQPTFDHQDIDTIWEAIRPFNGKNITSWDRIDDPRLLEDMLLKWMGKHNSQAAETPLAQPLWQSKLDNPQIRASILNGTFHDPTLPPEVSEFLRTFAHSSPPSPVPFQYDFDRFCSYIQKTNEKIASSPSGRHLGHYKALYHMKHQKLLHAIFDIMSISMKYSVILDRYLGVALTLLEKDEGSPKIHRLRPIALVETELNCIAKAHWAQDLMTSIETQHLITDDQYGGRKGRLAQSAVMNKVLYFNLQHQYVEAASFIDKDARNCFDRFIPNLITLENERLGSPTLASTFMIQTLRNQKIRARTSYGVTNHNISDVSSRPHFGSGQGIGWSGEACAASLNSVSRALSGNTYGLTYTSPNGLTTVTTSGDCFVDDTELGINESSLPDTTDLLTATQTTDQKHTLYWFSTGGLNANDKGTWYYITFYFDNGIPKFRSIDTSPAALHTQPTFSSPPVITPRLEYNTAHKTLGCLVTPNMNPLPQLTRLKQILSNWVRRVTASSLTPTDIQRSFFSVLLPKLTYPIGLICLDYEQCDKLMSIITPTLLHSAHFHKNFSRALTHAPPRYGGLRFPHLFYVHLQSKIKLFTFHYRRQDKTGKLLKISIQVSQLQCGMPVPFYTLPHHKWYSLLTPTWFTHLWSLLTLCDVRLTLTDPWIYTPPRRHDKYIMEFLAPHLPSPSVHYSINACRIALQLITLSDLVTLDGRRVLPNILQGQSFRTSTLKWPKQTIPSHWWSTWNQYVTTYILPHVATHPLGAWTSPTHQRWGWRQHSQSTIVSPSGQPHQTTSTSRVPVFHPSLAIFPPLPPLAPILDVTCINSSYRILSSHLPLHFPPPQPASYDYSFLHKHEKFHRRTPRRLTQLLTSAKILIATDGSAFDKDKASFSSLLASPKGRLLYSNYGPVLGDPEYLASDRAELTAILSIITRIPHLYNFFEIPFPSTPLQLYTDSEIAIKLIGNRTKVDKISSTFLNNIDIVLEIHSILDTIPISYSFHHISSHQDKELPASALTIPAKLNIEADRIADLQYLRPRTEHEQLMPHLPAQQVSFSSSSYRLTHNTLEEVIRHHRDSNTESVLPEHWQINSELLHHIDWLGLHNTFSTQPQFSSSLSKTIHSQWDTQARKRKWHQSTTALCPLCSSAPENCTHVLRCSHSVLKKARTDSLQDIITSLRKHNTAPLILRRIQHICQQWTSHAPIKTYSGRKSPLHRLMKKTMSNQKSIGFFNFFKGIISNQWNEVQRQYCITNKLKYSQAWSKHLIASLLQHSHLMWKSRCRILHLDNIGTFEHSLRQSAYSLLQSLRSDTSQISYCHRTLLRRTYDFFFNASISSVRMWMSRTQTAIKYAKARQSQLGSDIRNWVLVRPYDPGRRERGVRVPNRRRLFRLR